jgi:hypothetical protein
LLSFEGIDTNTSTEPAQEPNDDVDMMDEEKDPQSVLFAKSIGVDDVPQYDDPMFEDAGNIDKPSLKTLQDECKRRGINVTKPIRMDKCISELQDPSTVTDHTHSKDDIADMKQKVTEWYEEARAIVDTDISSYRGKHREDRPIIEVDWTGRAIVEPARRIARGAATKCCEGRFENGTLLLR